MDMGDPKVAWGVRGVIGKRSSYVTLIGLHACPLNITYSKCMCNMHDQLALNNIIN